MRIIKLTYFTILIFTVIFGSCRHNGKGELQPTPSERVAAAVDEAQEVEVIVIKRSDFRRDIISNGRLNALQRADLEFRTRERIASIKVRNGDHVSAGEVVATLDTFTLDNTLVLSRDQYERSLLEFQDMLLAQGYRNTDTSMIPRPAVKAARIRSGLDKAAADLRMAEYNLSEALLRAPFAGVVANLFTHENDLAVPGSPFCTVIDDNRFVAFFPVLESELLSLRKGQTVRIVPFLAGNEEYTGVINSINPVVDNNGMVRVGALVTNSRRTLFEGMNVKVIAGEKIPGQLVIPRQAVVLRSEKQVVFTCSNGRAKWVYVTTGLENLDSYTVNEGLNEGDSVIVSGNFNLNHDSRIFLK